MYSLMVIYYKVLKKVDNPIFSIFASKMVVQTSSFEAWSFLNLNLDSRVISNIKNLHFKLLDTSIAINTSLTLFYTGGGSLNHPW